MIKRRDFLKMAGLAGWSLASGSLERFLNPQAYAASESPVFSGTKAGIGLTKYLDPLPLIDVMPNTGTENRYWVEMAQVTQKIHRNLPFTKVWGYGPLGSASWPGRTIEARVNVPTVVRWINNLPSVHLLSKAIDHTIHGAENTYPDVRTVVHLHGGATRSASDGYPEAWYSPSGVSINGQGKNYADSMYDNGQLPCALWYHDHSLGITRLNIMAGLAGLYLLRDDGDTGGPPSAKPSRRPGENAMGLPGPAPGRGSAPYEIPLIIQDRALNVDGSLFYPAKGVNPEVHPQWIQDFFGDVICVNGKAWPYLDLEPRRYRFRILNGCNSRILNLSLDSHQSLFQIGSDGGFLPEVVQLNSLLIGPAERADVIIDFTGMAQATITMINDARTPLLRGEAPAPETTGQVMQFRVRNTLLGRDQSLPPLSIPLPAFTDLHIIVTTEMLKNPRRSFVYVVKGVNGPIMLTFNNTRWRDPITEDPRVGSTEVWEMINTAADFHPLHLHLIQFQLINRQAFDAQAYTAALASRKGLSVPDPTPYLKGKPVPPTAGEAGWKDTILNPTGMVTRIAARWAPQAASLTGPGSPSPGVNLYPFDPTRGKYVWHCHNLEHEDNELMRPYVVLR
jgi:spore coat protein A, manganese oxidase